MILYFNWHFYSCDTRKVFHIARRKVYNVVWKPKKVRAIQHQTMISAENGSGLNLPSQLFQSTRGSSIVKRMNGKRTRENMEEFSL